MQKTLSSRISERVRNNNRASRTARNLAAFLAQRDEIGSALKDGWTVYQIWETLHAEQKIAGSYNTFCNQVKRLILKRDRPASSANGPAFVKSFPPPHRAAKPDTRSGFTFSSTPNDEDIL